MNRLFSALPTTVFETMSCLAREHDAINLGQGFPDDPGPEAVRRAAADAVVDGWNQYPPMMGLDAAREALAAFYAAEQGIALDWRAEVMVTSGATEALAAAMFSLIEPGDEVILFPPMYDAYLPLVKRAGGVPVFVPLEPPSWRFDADVLRKAFTPKTRVVLLNNPVNPSGTLIPREDLELLGALTADAGAIVVSDEVWEGTVYDDAPFTSVLHIDALRHSAVKIGSAGKLFSLTGWKVGWVCAAPALTAQLARAHQFLTFTTPPNLQAAVAFGLGEGRGSIAETRAMLQGRRDRFAGGLERLGFRVNPCAGTYFLTIDTRGEDDVAFCERLVRQGGVAAIPVSHFYAGHDPQRGTARLCFAKSPATLDAALDRLAAFVAKAA
ncbi:aminotransferase [Futiania mangrovi]|uniref:Aminotransferase n=1 Tax=Futiania mangrovi TaxID=2959716 RepID=A0A9J6PG22_9PROT|nr:aminotransferase [Futiania mangrovii]MCP1337673.1 aminotransferase [Futiania mangrovii]